MEKKLTTFDAFLNELLNEMIEQEKREAVKKTETKKVYEAPETFVSTSTQPMAENNNGVEKVEPNRYFLNYKVGRYTTEDVLELVFNSKSDDNLWTPGITNRQLVQVLIDRYSAYPEKVALLNQLL